MLHMSPYTCMYVHTLWEGSASVWFDIIDTIDSIILFHNGIPFTTAILLYIYLYCYIYLRIYVPHQRLLSLSVWIPGTGTAIYQFTVIMANLFIHAEIHCTQVTINLCTLEDTVTCNYSIAFVTSINFSESNLKYLVKLVSIDHL